MSHENWVLLIASSILAVAGFMATRIYFYIEQNMLITRQNTIAIRELTVEMKNVSHTLASVPRMEKEIISLNERVRLLRRHEPNGGVL